MNKTMIIPKELKNKIVLDRNSQEIGRVKYVEQELRTGRFSTLQVALDPEQSQMLEFARWNHIPLSTTDIEIRKNSVKLNQTLAELNQMFSTKVSVNHKLVSPTDFVGRPVFDKKITQIGTVKDFRTPTSYGEFPTLLIELEPNIIESQALQNSASIRVSTEYIERVGPVVRLNRDVTELSKDWNEITVYN